MKSNFAESPKKARAAEILRKFLGSAEHFRLRSIPSFSCKSYKVICRRESFYLKLADCPRSKSELLRGTKMQTLARENGVRTPSVVAIGGSADEVFVIQSWVEGQNGTRAFKSANLSELTALTCLLGENIGLLHRINKTGCPDETGTEDWSEFCFSRLKRLFRENQIVGNLDEKLLQAVFDRCCTLLQEFSVKHPDGLVHWDLHLDNVLVDEGRNVTIIDFDRANFGDPLVDFVKLGNCLFEPRPQSFSSFMDVYQSLISLDSEWSLRVYLYQGIEYLSAFSVIHYFPRTRRYYYKLLTLWLENSRNRWERPAKII